MGAVVERALRLSLAASLAGRSASGARGPCHAMKLAFLFVFFRRRLRCARSPSPARVTSSPRTRPSARTARTHSIPCCRFAGVGVPRGRGDGGVGRERRDGGAAVGIGGAPPPQPSPPLPLPPRLGRHTARQPSPTTPSAPAPRAAATRIHPTRYRTASTTSLRPTPAPPRMCLPCALAGQVPLSPGSVTLSLLSPPSPTGGNSVVGRRPRPPAGAALYDLSAGGATRRST